MLEVQSAPSSPHLVTTRKGVTTAKFFEQDSVLVTNPEHRQEMVVFGIPCSQRPNNKSVQVNLVTVPFKLFLDSCVLVQLPIVTTLLLSRTTTDTHKMNTFSVKAHSSMHENILHNILVKCIQIKGQDITNFISHCALITYIHSH